jgi:1-aminocyclopropane-1-carboxylate deaminase/D-cysteine desulfhydrase-like pyridoxal-dependent ACC family enzyme
MGARATALSVVAYVECVVEIVEQAAAQGVRVDTLVVASGNGTHAGVALGAKALGLPDPTLSFRPSPTGTDEAVADVVARLANEGAEILGLNTRLSGGEVENRGRYAGEAYGLVTKAGLDALQLLARTEGILLDPVYTGKAVAGLIDYLRTGCIPPGRNVVYIHTGGTPALFAYANELMEHTDNPPRVVTDLAAGVM